MRLKISSLVVAMLFVAACQTAPQESADSGGTGASTTPQTTAPTTTAPTQTTATPAPAPAGPAAGSQEDLKVNVGDRVFFGYDQFNLQGPARETLERQAVWLKKYPAVTVTVEGHCDERGTREYNLALGDRRAQSVKDYLVSLGVDPSRVATISYGKERPEELGHNDSAWAQNRRGVSIVN